MHGSLILYGFYSAGKTTIGKRCALNLNISFVDTDLLIEEKTQKKPRDLWKEIGEEAFRDVESEIIHSLKGEAQVISLGGGGVMRESNVLNLKKLGTLIYLKTHTSTLLQRMEKRGFPAFITNREEFEALVAIRFPLYEKASDWIIETDYLTENEVADKICARIKGS